MDYFKVIKKEGNTLTFELGNVINKECSEKRLYNIILDSLQLILFPNEISGLYYEPRITNEIQQKAQNSPQEQSFKEYGEYEFTAGQIPSATGDEKYLKTFVPKAIKKVELLEENEPNGDETFGDNEPIYWKGTYQAQFTDAAWFDFLPGNWIKEIF